MNKKSQNKVGIVNKKKAGIMNKKKVKILSKKSQNKIGIMNKNEVAVGRHLSEPNWQKPNLKKKQMLQKSLFR